MLQKVEIGTARCAQKLIIVLLGFVVFTVGTPAPRGEEIGAPFIRNFLPKEYEGHPQVWAIVEDHRGVLYFGTSTGLHEFDGTNWRRIDLGDLSVARVVAVDKADVVFVGGNQNFGYLVSDRSGRIQYESLLEKIPEEHREFKELWHIFTTSHGTYFITAKQSYRWHDNRIDVIPYGAKNCAVLVGDEIFLNTPDGFGSISDGDFSPINGAVLSAEEYGLVRGYPFPGERKLLLFSSKKGLLTYSLNTQSSTKTPLRPEPFSNQANDYLIHNNAYKMVILRDGSFAISTITGGVVVLNKTGALVRVINTNRGLGKNTVYSVYEDRFGDLWVGMQGGIAHIALSSPVTGFGTESGIPSSVNAVIRHKGTLYTGTISNGLARLPAYELSLENDAHRFEFLTDPPMPFTWSFLSLDETLLVGSKSVLRVDDGKVEAIPGTPVAYSMSLSKRFAGLVFLGITEVSDGGVGILKYSQSQSQGGVSTVFEYGGKLEGIHETIREITQDKDGNLWLSTLYSGLIYLRFISDDPHDFEITRFTEKQGLPSPKWNRAFLDEGRVLVATEKGIYKYMPGKESHLFVPETAMNEGLNASDSEVIKITAYDERKWIIASLPVHGILSRNTDNTYQSDNRPFQGIEEGTECTTTDADGVVWIGGGTGLHRWDPRVKKDYGFSYATIIRSVRTNLGREVFAGAYVDLASKTDNHFSRTTNTQPLSMVPKFEYEENGLMFEFSALFFEHAADVVYQYQLEGFDKGWSEWSKTTQKEYTNIPEGSYTFEVRARNIFGTISESASYGFKVRPPNYRTIWAYVLYALAFFVLLFGGIRFNTRRLRLAKRRLEKIVRRRTREVVAQRDEISLQKDQIEEARNALWGEMELAKKIQTVLLPEDPKIPGYEISGYMKPADEVGGDYYDIINIENKNWLIIGDVSGHGVPAGLVMMMVQTAINQSLIDNVSTSPEKILSKVNQNIHGNISRLGESKYMTITLLSLEEDGTVEFSGLHQDILVYRESKKMVEPIETRGMWLGLVDDIVGMNSVDRFQLHPGDTVLLYTDGIIEACDSTDDMYGDEQLKTLFENIGGQSTAEISKEILKSLEGYEATDDVTLLVVKRLDQ